MSNIMPPVEERAWRPEGWDQIEQLCGQGLDRDRRGAMQLFGRRVRATKNSNGTTLE